MCISALLSLFGCRNKKNNPLILDGPDMEREVWREFTISASTVTYEPTYSYTVRIDGTSQKGYLDVNYTENGYGESGIELESKTVNALLNLQITEFPDAQSVEGSFIGLSVIDSKGQTLKKSVSSANESEILALIKPYVKENKQEKPEMLDGPSMTYTPPWYELSVSVTASIVNDSFYFDVVDTEEKTTVAGSCMDSEGHYYEIEEPVEIPYECLQQLYQLGFEGLDNVEDLPLGTDNEEEIILDGTKTSITITTNDGKFEKLASESLAKEVYKILLPYFQQSVN